MVKFNEDKQKAKLEEFRKKEEEDLAQFLSSRYSIPYINLATVPINTDALRLIPEATARDSKAAAFDVIGKRLKLVMLSPKNEKTALIIKKLEEDGYEVLPYAASTTSLDKAFSRYKELSYSAENKTLSLELSNEQLEKFLQKVESLDDVKKMSEELLLSKKTYKTSKILEIILAGALATEASDIHLEPEEDYVRLRYRLDGVLADILNFNQSAFALLLSRIKLISGLKLNVKNEAQDGRFTVKARNEEIEIRTSVLPGAYNESIVLRILNPKTISVPMEELGIEPKLMKILAREIKKPNGMILTTGPTGSGKTTTLYAFIKKIHSPDIKIITIEDPIEYHLPGIVQTQVSRDEKYTFLSGLRSALRQDPDVLMIGEIRDGETAEIAVNSALTGHLVFSTLHTNTAAGSFPRLMDLNINPKVITSAINIALAQRLVRKLCPYCKKEVPLEGKEKELVEKILGSIQDRSYLEGIRTKSIWKEAGCEKCNGTGYKGRTGIFEAILIDESVEGIIQENPSEREIKKATAHQGLLDMKQDGILKILKGLTSISELERVIDLS
ncbi:MAG: type II/IV secretion system protein [Patescibacteria group bacterium]|nr:type II/IV secretion system protein [Patescibacteria group bacterium]MDE2218552.1 type II/IV secretion system protein [Patescibacteria group bacterium]